MEAGIPGGVERRGTGAWDTVLEREAYLVAPGGEWRSELRRIAAEQFAARLRAIYP